MAQRLLASVHIMVETATDIERTCLLQVLVVTVVQGNKSVWRKIKIKGRAIHE